MKSKQAFLFIIFIVCCFIFGTCVNEPKPANQTKETIVNKKENTNQLKKANAQKKKKKPSPKTQKENTPASSSKKNISNNTATKKPLLKKPSPKQLVSNLKKSDKERMSALQTFDKRTLTKDDYVLLKSLVQNEKESIKIRQEALKKIYKPGGEDEEMLDYLFDVLQNKNDVLKKDALYALQTIKYSSSLLQKKQSAFLSALKTGLYNTNDKKTYYMLLKALSDANDPFAHEIAIDLLKQEDFSKLSLKQLLQLLKKNVHPQHYPVLHRIMQNTSNTKIKIQLISLLVKHPNSKAKFIQYLGNKKQDIKTRIACAEILMEHDQLSFYSYTKNIIWDKEDDIQLRRKCLELVSEVDLKILRKYANLYEDMANIGISDNALNQLRETLLKKLNKNQY